MSRRFAKVMNVSHFGPMGHLVRQKNFRIIAFSIRILFLEVRDKPGDASKSKGLRKNSFIQNGRGLSYVQFTDPKSQKSVGPVMTQFSLSGVLLFEL